MERAAGVVSVRGHQELLPYWTEPVPRADFTTDPTLARAEFMSNSDRASVITY